MDLLFSGSQGDWMISYANPKAQYQANREAIDSAIQRVLESSWYILGDEVRHFEQEFAAYIGVRHAVGVGSGTEALHIALRALEIGPGDEVITAAHTAVATASAIDLCGAKSVFVDIEPGYFTLDPRLIEAAITSRTKAIIPVHLYGQPCDMNPILDIARRHDVQVIEDCAHAHGAEYKGKRVGALGAIGCFSYYPTKNLGAIGDGGALVTDDALLEEKFRLLREYGWKERNVSSAEGWNSRLDEIQAAILRVKLNALDADNDHRRRHAEKYQDMLQALPLQLPKLREDVSHVYHLFVVQTDNRDTLKTYLREQGIQTAIHYPVPIHQQDYYRKIIGHVSLPVTEEAAVRVLSLPMYPEFSELEQQKVIECVKRFGSFQ